MNGWESEPEVLLARLVLDWVGKVLPDEPTVSEQAARLAVGSYVGGASVGEACREARRFVGSWCRHPSHRRPSRNVMHRLAS